MKDEWCKLFVADNGTHASNPWKGVYMDLFSPDSSQPDVYKFVEDGNSFNYGNDGMYHINEMSPKGTWGKKWDNTTTVDP